MSKSAARIPPVWTTGWTDELNTGTWRNAIAVHRERPAPCHGACPVDGDIPVWIDLVRKQDIQGAWRVLVEHNPIPAVIGRTCHRPCEDRCNRNAYDGAVSINALEQYVGDTAIREGWTFPAPVRELQEMVAVIGGGPAGLSCAYQLRRMGFQVTIYDSNPELGGVLRYGVPEFRLPKDVVAAEIGRIVGLGVRVVSGRTISAVDLTDLEKEYSAVFIAFGAHKRKSLPQFPENDPRIGNAIDFLRSFKLGPPAAIGKSVLVVGGGSVAMDVAASALRLGSAVKIIAVEGRAAMPARQDEIQDVLDEGALLIDGAMVKTVDEAADGFKLRCVRAELDPNVPAGVIRPIEIEGTEFDLDADTVILAVGQDPELQNWEVRIGINKKMIVINDCYMTGRAGVFAGGDVANVARFVSTAVGDGKRAAQSIARYLGRGEPDSAETPVDEVRFTDINTFYFPLAERGERNKLGARMRYSGFAEIRLGLEVGEAQSQAERCFSCGSCTQCDNCFYFCPDVAIVKDPSSPLHYSVLDQYCKGCGCCVRECPRGAIGLSEEVK